MIVLTRGLDLARILSRDGGHSRALYPASQTPFYLDAEALNPPNSENVSNDRTPHKRHPKA